MITPFRLVWVIKVCEGVLVKAGKEHFCSETRLSCTPNTDNYQWISRGLQQTFFDSVSMSSSTSLVSTSSGSVLSFVERNLIALSLTMSSPWRIWLNKPPNVPVKQKSNCTVGSEYIYLIIVQMRNKHPDTINAGQSQSEIFTAQTRRPHAWLPGHQLEYDWHFVPTISIKSKNFGKIF